ncbi:hypothetical protein AB0M47_21935 [Hamadaea sp. NPDC051192]|uniref:hypothetical protein n=1 Tax=Hamadaea sp. NPDC051192 TaxID=3154940 RepID=UPI003437F694
MTLTDDQRDGLNRALNEATWLGLTVDADAGRVTTTFDVLTLPEVGPSPEHALATLVLDGVSRVAASLRNGMWYDRTASVETLQLAQLPETVDRVSGHPIYGCEFVDPPERSWASWRDRLSLDVNLAEPPGRHVLDLFQEAGRILQHLDLRIWFDSLRVTDPDGGEIPLQDFIDGGVRWWDALFARDPRTQGRGIVA